MKTGKVQWVVVGADRICANGDVANKIGTYQLAIAATPPRGQVHGRRAVLDRRHGHRQRRPDRDRGARSGRTASRVGGSRTVAEGIAAWNPVFDVTPHELIDAIVTEQGVIERPDAARDAGRVRQLIRQRAGAGALKIALQVIVSAWK